MRTRYLPLLLIGLAAPVSAQPAGDTLRLSPEERAQVLNGTTEASAANAQAGLGDGARHAPAIHGEVGAMLGSNGARGLYGAAAIPLGDRAQAAVSFETSRYGHPR